MKILTAPQIREADRITVQRQGITSFQLMQRASAVCAEVICNRYDPSIPFSVICGTGNNGGDGLCIARILHRVGYTVQVFVVATSKQPSDDFMQARRELEATPGMQLMEGIADPVALQQTVVIDALFGTGLHGPVTGNGLQAIRNIRASGAETISIDLPSGMPADPVPDAQAYEMVHADLTLTFQCAKLSMLLPACGEAAGTIQVVDIRLDTDYISHIPDRYMLADETFIQTLVRPRQRFSHKGTYGHALLVAGSTGKTGAAILAAKAGLRSGCGLLTVHLPGSGLNPMQTAVPEAMVSLDTHADRITSIPDTGSYSAIGMGPGIGTHPETAEALARLLKTSPQQPFILDADALNILSKHPELMKLLPSSTILTPHPGEFRRLAGDWQGDAGLLEKAERFALEHRVILVLKGHHTLITNGTQTWFNNTGNSGMAKGGSGDALTGLITGLAASGYQPLEAALLGVFAHGTAGDRAAEKFGMASMTPGDLILRIRIPS